MAIILQNTYANLIDAKLRATLVTKEGYIFNTKVEGNALAGTVKIPTTNESAVVDYNKANGIAGVGVDVTYIDMSIDKDKAVNEVIDGFEASAVPVDVLANRIDTIGYALGSSMDIDGLASLASGGTAFGNTTALTKTTAYEAVLDAATQLSENKVPLADRFVIVTPKVYSLLMKDPQFIRSNSLAQELIFDGVIGMVDGVKVFQSANLPEKVEFIIGHPQNCYRAEAWKVDPKIVDLSGSGKYVGASAVQGRKVYAHKVSNPNTVLVKKQA